MKKAIIFSTLYLFIAPELFSQQNDPKPTLSHSDYSQKSKKQLKSAWVLAGTGTALIITGAIIKKSTEDQYSSFDGGRVLTRLGIVTGLSSIPFFILSAKNKKLAEKTTTFLKIESTPTIQGYSIKHNQFPALSVKIAL